MLLIPIIYLRNAIAKAIMKSGERPNASQEQDIALHPEDQQIT
jgi:hypothetical protein